MAYQMTSWQSWRSSTMLGRIVACLMMANLAAGCGRGAGDGPARYDISGNVIYNGKPVPAGRVQFIPDTTQGNKGPASYAIIHDGAYNTAKDGKGTVGGPHRVIITGFQQPSSAPVQSDDELADQSLFPEWSTMLDLPRQTTRHDFEVPFHEK